jgi:hypothetical protein
MNDKKLAEIKVVPVLLDVFYYQRGKPIPEAIVGSTILAFGTIPENNTGVEGGGLVIDYLPRDGQRTRRAVLAFTELGMWVGFETELAIPSPAEGPG